MRKQLKLLLLVATIVALFAMAMIVGSAATLEVGTADDLMAAIGDCTAETPVAGTAQAGDTVKLTADITLADGVKINLDKAITLDGDGHTINFLSSTGFLIRFYSGGVTVKNVTITSPMTTAGSKGIANGLFTIPGGVNGKFVIDGVTANIKGSILRHMAGSGNLSDGYDVEIKNSNLTAGEDARFLVIGQYAASSDQANNRQKVTFTNCTLNVPNTVDKMYAFCAEGAIVTFDSCTIDCPKGGSNGAFLYGASLTTDFIIKSESAPYKTVINCGSFAQLKGGSSITIGRDGEDDDITLNVTGFMTRNSQTQMSKFAIYGTGTVINHSGTQFIGYFYLNEFVAKGATIILEQGCALLQEYKNTNQIACAASFEGCTIVYATEVDNAEHGIYYNNQATRCCAIEYKDCTIIVCAPLYTVEGEGDAAVITPFALLENDELDTIDNVVILAPGGTVVNSSLTITPYAQTVKFADKDLKIWFEVAGDFANNISASVRVDTSTATSGIRFNTELDSMELMGLLMGYGFDDTNLLQEVDGYTLKFYTLITPMDYALNADSFTKEGLNALNVEGTKYVAIQADNTLNKETYVEDMAITYSGALVDLQSYTRVYAAIAMIEVCSGGDVVETFYSNFSTAANGYTAQQIATAVQGDEWLPEQKVIVDAYVAGVKA